MNLNDIGVPDISALVRFGRIGVQMMASRILSLTALFGTIALGAYAVYTASYIGAGVVLILALFVFIPALKSESGRAQEVKNDQP